MLYVSTEDFLEKIKDIPPLTREEELSCARRMKAGDGGARERIIAGYLPHVAAVVRRSQNRSLELMFRCCACLEKLVDSFDFLQDSETFSHRLSWGLRQTVTRYIADRRG